MTRVGALLIACSAVAGCATGTSDRATRPAEGRGLDATAADAPETGAAVSDTPDVGADGGDRADLPGDACGADTAGEPTDVGSVADVDEPGDGGGSDAAPADASPPIDTTLADGSGEGDGGDAASTWTPPPPPTPCAAHPPVLVFGAVAQVHGTELTFTPLAGGPPQVVAAWAPPAQARRPAAAPALGDAPAVLLALSGGGTCRLLAASAAGEVVWEIAFEADDCRAPAIDGGRAVLGVTVGGVGRLQVRSLANGALLGERTLPGTCGADPGRLESGGSHWVVGAGDQVVLLDVSGDTPAVLQAADAGFLVEAVIALGSGGFVAAGGETLRVFTVADGTGGTALVAGSPIAAPGTLLSDPLAAPDCDPVASGGSHWWCPGGLVVAGGDGWLAAWALDGTVRYAQSTEDSVTGLALGDDGRVYSGGSHWLTGEGGWSLVAWSGPSGAPESLAGGATPAGVCVASPLVDTDGRVILDIGPDGPAVIPALAGGLAPGWARSGGSNTGAGTPADPGAPCPGGAVHLFSRPVVLDGLFSALSVAALPGGAAVMGGALSPEPFATGVPILVAIDAAGRRQWVLDLDDGDPSHPTVLNTVEVAGGALALMRGIPDGVTAGTRVVRVTADGQVAWDRFEGQVPNAWVRDAVELESGNIAVMGAYAPAEPTGDTWILLLDAAGGVLDSVPFDADGPVEIVTGTALPGDAGVVIGGLSGTDAYVGSWTLAGAADWQDIVPGTAARVVDVIPLSGGRTLAIGRDGDAAFTRIYSAGGALLGSSTLTGAFHPVAVRRSTTGRLVAFGDQFEVMLLSEGGAAGPIVAHAPGEPVQYGAAAASLAGGALLMVGQIAEVDFSVARGLALRIEPFGHAGCAAAGACVAVPGLDCGDSDPCTLDGCDPATGACTHAPLPDGAPCGDGTVCVAGACQSP